MGKCRVLERESSTTYEVNGQTYDEVTAIYRTVEMTEDNAFAWAMHKCQCGDYVDVQVLRNYGKCSNCLREEMEALRLRVKSLEASLKRSETYANAIQEKCPQCSICTAMAHRDKDNHFMDANVYARSKPLGFWVAKGPRYVSVNYSSDNYHVFEAQTTKEDAKRLAESLLDASFPELAIARREEASNVTKTTRLLDEVRKLKNMLGLGVGNETLRATAEIRLASDGGKTHHWVFLNTKDLSADDVLSGKIGEWLSSLYERLVKERPVIESEIEGFADYWGSKQE